MPHLEDTLIHIGESAKQRTLVSLPEGKANSPDSPPSLLIKQAWQRCFYNETCHPDQKKPHAVISFFHNIQPENDITNIGLQYILHAALARHYTTGNCGEMGILSCFNSARQLFDSPDEAINSKSAVVTQSSNNMHSWAEIRDEDGIPRLTDIVVDAYAPGMMAVAPGQAVPCHSVPVVCTRRDAMTVSPLYEMQPCLPVFAIDKHSWRSVQGVYAALCSRVDNLPFHTKAGTQASYPQLNATFNGILQGSIPPSSEPHAIICDTAQDYNAHVRRLSAEQNDTSPPILLASAECYR